MGMLLYNLLLSGALLAGAPVWGWRMLRHRRYRAGLRQRLGRVSEAVAAGAQGKRAVWVHAVSVGEVLAAERLVQELSKALGPAWLLVVSTTTETGQQIARERFGPERVLYWPLDFAWVVRRFLRALRPELLVLVESELWPRMLRQCRASGVPVVVVNARMSDRSFARARRVPWLWRWLAAGVAAFFAQGEETAARLRALGARDVRVLGNLKYDLATKPGPRALAADLEHALRDRALVVAGSTLEGEEQMLLDAWPAVLAAQPKAVLLIAPRHPQRFPAVKELLLRSGFPLLVSSQKKLLLAEFQNAQLILLDSLGELAEMYGVAKVAFVGGSLVARGGHNPLEAARFGVPVVMGPSYENFREIVEGMRTAGAIHIVEPDGLADALLQGVSDGTNAGKRGREFFRSQSGATARTVRVLQEMLNA